MKIKCLYRKNLNLSEGKLAAQTGHVVGNLLRLNQEYGFGDIDRNTTIVVLKASDKKFEEKHQELEDLHNNSELIYYLQVDRGFSEISEGTQTVIGWIEHEN